MSESVELLEFVRQSGPFEVDAEAAVIKGVRVIGLESANGRTYTREAVRGALGMYEGVGTNVNHPGRPGEPVTVERRNGWLANVRQDPDGGARADWHLLKADGMTAKILEVAARRPQLLALSHNATGRTRKDGGREIVESIQAVHSVDCVVDGATTRGLHEGLESLTGTAAELAEQLRATRPGAARALSEMAEAGLVSNAARMQVPAQQPGATEAADHSAMFLKGIKDAINACLDDPTLPWDEKDAAVSKYMKMGGKHMKGADMSGDANKTTEGAKTTPSPETVALQEQLDREKLKVRSLTLLLESGLTMNPVLAKALQGCQTEDEVKALLEECKKLRTAIGASPPRSSERGAGGSTGTTPITEGKAPTEAKAFAAFVKG